MNELIQASKALADGIDELMGKMAQDAPALLPKDVTAEPWGEGKYSPGVVTGTKREIVFGAPRREEICTSHAERQNLTMRMQMRRFTRLTNGFSKKVENHRLAVALYFVHYNFCRIHGALRITPAMAAGLTDHVWELSEMVGLLEAQETALCA